MKYQVLFLLGFLIFTKCAQTERSDIEKVTVNNELLKRIQTDYATLSVDTPKGFDFYRVEVYGIDSTRQNLIFRDSLDNILAIRLKENEKDVFVQEFYSNGQAKGKTDFTPGRIDGQTKYYYQDGRIKATGQWKSGQRTGTWKWYDENGLLTIIEQLDEEGNLLKWDTIK